MNTMREYQESFLLSLYKRRSEIQDSLRRISERKAYEEKALEQTEKAITELEYELNKTKEDE